VVFAILFLQYPNHLRRHHAFHQYWNPLSVSNVSFDLAAIALYKKALHNQTLDDLNSNSLFLGVEIFP